MKDATVTVNNPHGLHMRVAAEVVRRCRGFESAITLCKDCTVADVCSIMQLVMLGAAKGSELKIIAAGGDESAAVRELSSFFSEGGGI